MLRPRGTKRGNAGLSRPTGSGLAGSLEPPSVDELGQCARGSFRSPTRQAGQAREHGVRNLEANVREVAAVPRVPAECCPPKPLRVIDQEQDKLEGVGG